ncbi:DNA-directed DNA polymerase I [archaeon]|nr:MAG: DNA-directed DNA polymerase I [archaeon]
MEEQYREQTLDAFIREPEEYLLLGVDYDGEKNCAYAKLYDVKKHVIKFWYDNTGHKPYCLTDLEPSNVLSIRGIPEDHIDGFERVVKYDPLKFENVELTKIIGRTPHSIGGRKFSIRNFLPRVWEAKIRYHDCYIFDRGLVPGCWYKIDENGNLILSKKRLSKEIVDFIHEKLLKKTSKEEKELMMELISLLFQPIPELYFVALDIEVLSPRPDYIPDPVKAEHEIIACAFVSSKGEKEILLLAREKDDLHKARKLEEKGVKVEVFSNERQLLSRIFEKIKETPILVTFNGDNFDLRYIWNRAVKHYGFRKESIPIRLTKDEAFIRNGVHIDLYKFFQIQSVRVYAFSGKYTEVDLDSIGKALLGKGKITLEKEISKLSIEELAEYCLNDAEITCELLLFNNRITLQLIILLMRISKISIEDLTRSSISKWIRNMLYFEHRKRGYLIPNREDIMRLKGAETSTKAKVKGKFQGAIVIAPKPGVHFNVVVVDFASLYPSIIKTRNISYETIRCPHEKCKRNVLPGVSHWVCTVKRGVISLIVGVLRDLRVHFFKKMAKDESISHEEREFANVIQNALKVFVNASYGVMGNENFAFYCPAAAESITSVGRHAILAAVKKANELGLNVIYGDTDSLFIKDPPKDKLKELLEWAEKRLKIEFDIDKVYRYVALSRRKKNYFGVYENGKVDVKGLLGKKRNVPLFLKKAFNETLEALSLVKSIEDFKKAKEKIREIVSECYRKLERREYSLEELAFRVTLSKPPETYVKTTPQHVKAARMLEMVTGRKMKAGDIISFVKVRGMNGVKPLELARIEEIDVEKYREHIRSTFEQIMDSLDISFDELEGKKFRSLEEFF